MTEVNFFWIGKSVSNVELLAFSACWKNGHRPVVWSFDAVENLPSFVTVRNAAEIMEASYFRHLREGLKLSFAVTADVFRYEMLHRTGGYYSDTDVVITRNVDAIHFENYFCSTYEYEWGECANNCFMKLKAGSDVTAYLRNECAKRLSEIEANGMESVHYCYLGPFLVQQCAREMNVTVLPWDYLNPISWRWVPDLIAFRQPNAKFLLKTRIRRTFKRFEHRGYGITKNTFGVHLCNDIWKQSGLGKNEKYHPLSVYERLRKKYSAVR